IFSADEATDKDFLVRSDYGSFALKLSSTSLESVIHNYGLEKPSADVGLDVSELPIPGLPKRDRARQLKDSFILSTCDVILNTDLLIKACSSLPGERSDGHIPEKENKDIGPHDKEDDNQQDPEEVLMSGSEMLEDGLAGL